EIVDRVTANTESESLARGNANRRIAPGAAPSSITLPTTRYIKENDAEGRWVSDAIPQDAGQDEPAESHWPLAALLVATQCSVGMVIVSAMLSLAWLATGSVLSPTIPLTVLTTAFLIAVAGLNLAPLHLGQPLRMWRVFLGLRTSWLSREAVILGKYVGAIAAAIGILVIPMLREWLPQMVTDTFDDWVPGWAAMALLLGSIPLGLAGLYSSAMIYIATHRPAWNFRRTMQLFGGTVLCTGTCAAAAALSLASCLSATLIPKTLIVAMCILSSLLLAGKYWIEQRLMFHPTASDDDDTGLIQRTRALLTHESFRSPIALRRLAMLFAVALMVGGSIACAIGAALIGPIVLMAATIVMLLGEFLERVLYFQSVVYARMPGVLRPRPTSSQTEAMGTSA
ncbi:MAG: DmsC/YnfH family molybdoenzyme membrane anchor subunit, partial [Planctomycetota bacterium]